MRKGGDASVPEMQNLQDALPLETLPAQRSITKTRRAWQFLHPALWLLLLCIGGPILLYELAIQRLDNKLSTENGMVYYSSFPCDVQDIWTSWSTLFEMNIRTGHLSFSNAKMIDVAFDLVVGRGGQACLAWIAYRVYTDVLIRITENGRIRFDLFAAVSLFPNQLRTISGTAAASFSSAHNLPTKFMLIWTMLAMLYVLAYPTLVSSATSLVNATTTSIKLVDNGTAPLDAYVNSAAYSFANSGLAAKPDPWIVSVVDINQIGNMCNIMYLGQHQFSVSHENGNDVVVNQTTYTLGNQTQTTCGFHYENHFYPVDMSKLESTTSPNEFLADQTVCQPDGHNYQWGASWELLVVLLILQISWSFSMLFIWMEVTKHSQLVQRGRKMGMWRAVLDLAEPLLLRLGPGIGMYNEAELLRSSRQILYVNYEAMVMEVQDGGYSQDVRLVSSFETAVK
jgi:hypothetical protein